MVGVGMGEMENGEESQSADDNGTNERQKTLLGKRNEGG